MPLNICLLDCEIIYCIQFSLYPCSCVSRSLKITEHTLLLLGYFDYNHKILPTSIHINHQQQSLKVWSQWPITLMNTTYFDSSRYCCAGLGCVQWARILLPDWIWGWWFPRGQGFLLAELRRTRLDLRSGWAGFHCQQRKPSASLNSTYLQEMCQIHIIRRRKFWGTWIEPVSRRDEFAVNSLFSLKCKSKILEFKYLIQLAGPTLHSRKYRYFSTA